MPAKTGVRRGCGDSRVEGGLYLEVGLSSIGAPLENFLYDPPQALTRDQLASIPRVGVTLVEDEKGIVHVIDWVGESSYPYATDFLEEARAKGVSRKISKLVEIDRLTPGKSMIHFVHRRGYLQNWEAYAEDEVGRSPSWGHCRKLHEHTDPYLHEHCIRFLWHAAEPGFYLEQDPPPRMRNIGDVRYEVFPPKAKIEPDAVPAFIARMPITNFTVIRDTDTGSHEMTARQARSRTHYDVFEADS